MPPAARASFDPARRLRECIFSRILIDHHRPLRTKRTAGGRSLYGHGNLELHSHATTGPRVNTGDAWWCCKSKPCGAARFATMGTCASQQRESLQPLDVPTRLPRTALEFEAFGPDNMLQCLRYLATIADEAARAGAVARTAGQGLCDAAQADEAATARRVEAMAAAAAEAADEQPPSPPPALCPPYVLTDPQSTSTQVVILDPAAEAVFLLRKLEQERRTKPARAKGKRSPRTTTPSPGVHGEVQPDVVGDGGGQAWGPLAKRRFALCAMHRELLEAKEAGDGHPRFYAPLDVQKIACATRSTQDITADGVRRHPKHGSGGVAPTGTGAAPLTVQEMNSLAQVYLEADAAKRGFVRCACTVAPCVRVRARELWT